MKFDYQIDEIQKKDAHQFVSRFHYSPVMPKITKHYLGFYLNDKLRGVLTLGWGVQPKQTFSTERRANLLSFFR